MLMVFLFILLELAFTVDFAIIKNVFVYVMEYNNIYAFCKCPRKIFKLEQND